MKGLGVLACAMLFVPAMARGAGLAVIPFAPGPVADATLERMVNELAARCPSSHVVPRGALAEVLPRFSRPSPNDPPPPLPPGADNPHVDFFRDNDLAGTAARLVHAAAELERDPLALLAFPERRRRLRELHLLAAQTFLRARDGSAARAQLLRLAVRLPDLPGARDAEWGARMSELDQEVRQHLPPPGRELSVEVPPGWAVHVDEQAAERVVALRVRPGPHAVVGVAPDGRRVSWVLDMAEGGPPLRLLADPRLAEVCQMGSLTGLCSPDEVPQGWPALARVLGEDLIGVRQRGGMLQAWRLRREEPVSPGMMIALAADPNHAVTTLTRQFCSAPPASSASASAEEAIAITRRGLASASHKRLHAWPGLALLSAGALATAAAASLYAYQGRCVGTDCTHIYDFQGLPHGLVGAGTAALAGGGLWLVFALR